MKRATSTFVVLFAASACATTNAPRSSTPPSTSRAIEPAAAPAPAGLPKPPANFFGEFAMGAGKYEHDTDGGGSSADGDTGGGYLRMRGEYLADMGIGGGMSIEGIGSEDDLFGGSQDSHGTMGDVFAYFLVVPLQTDVFRMPVRVGPYVHQTSIDDDASDTTVDWESIGGRVDVEPQVWVIQRDDFCFGFVGEFSLGFHATRIDVDDDQGGIHDDFDGNGLTFGSDLGVQALFGDRVTTRLSWVYRRTDEDESDTHNGLVVREMDASFNGIVLGVGFRF